MCLPFVDGNLLASSNGNFNKNLSFLNFVSCIAIENKQSISLFLKRTDIIIGKTEKKEKISISVLHNLIKWSGLLTRKTSHFVQKAPIINRMKMGSNFSVSDDPTEEKNPIFFKLKAGQNIGAYEMNPVTPNQTPSPEIDTQRIFDTEIPRLRTIITKKKMKTWDQNTMRGL